MDMTRWPENWQIVMLVIWVIDGLLVITLFSLLVYRCYLFLTKKHRGSISLNVEHGDGNIAEARGGMKGCENTATLKAKGMQRVNKINEREQSSGEFDHIRSAIRRDNVGDEDNIKSNGIISPYKSSEVKNPPGVKKVQVVSESRSVTAKTVESGGKTQVAVNGGNRLAGGTSKRAGEPAVEKDKQHNGGEVTKSPDELVVHVKRRENRRVDKLPSFLTVEKADRNDHLLPINRMAPYAGSYLQPLETEAFPTFRDSIRSFEDKVYF